MKKWHGKYSEFGILFDQFDDFNNYHDEVQHGFVLKTENDEYHEIAKDNGRGIKERPEEVVVDQDNEFFQKKEDIFADFLVS